MYVPGADHAWEPGLAELVPPSPKFHKQEENGVPVLVNVAVENTQTLSGPVNDGLIVATMTGTVTESTQPLPSVTISFAG